MAAAFAVRITEQQGSGPRSGTLASHLVHCTLRVSNERNVLDHHDVINALARSVQELVGCDDIVDDVRLSIATHTHTGTHTDVTPQITTQW